MTRPFRTRDFDYQLPPELIAQHPLPDRAASRLLVLDRVTGAVRHLPFGAIIDLVEPQDVLVLNVSRVIPARLHGSRQTGAPAELLLVRALPDGTWLAMGHPGGKLKPGRTVRFGSDSVAQILEQLGGGLRRVQFVGGMDAAATLAKYGEVPLPPYIRRAPCPEDRERYQTVYAVHDGSVAAPTAGLHFTPEILQQLRERGVAVAELDLHVGPGTFKPVASDDLARHTMHAEAYTVNEEAATAINARRGAGGRVWAVGTTVVRTLETVAQSDGSVRAASGDTALFIHPPYDFRVVDRLLTNFHLPRSPLLMLVSAFGGYDHMMRAYQEAVKQKYRFYSYGDAMAIV